MGAIANLSIRNKLVAIILGTSLLSLVTGFALVIDRSNRAFQNELVQSTALTARVLGQYSAIALYFESPELTQIEQLSEVADIVEAYLFDADGALFAAHGEATAEVDRLLVRDAPQTQIRSGYVHHSEPIFHEGKRVGTIYLRVATEPYQARLRAFRDYMTWLMAALVAIAIVFAYLLQGVISKPILRLAAAARRISDNADYSERVQKPGNDEIGVLYDGFNTMLAQIEQRQSELERSNRDLHQFAHVVSHDLKAPLRAIGNLSAWLAEDHDVELSADAAQKLTLLRARVKRMGALIDGILQYSRLDSRGSSGEPVVVAELVHEVIDLIAPPAGMQVEVTLPMPVLRTTRLRLEQVFSNLIANAVHYHHQPQQGRIEVSAERAAGGWRFTVRDDGPGIDPAHHDMVFMMFQTVPSRERPESTGLGLALVKKLVEDQGGAVSLASSLGAGAVFRFTWPAPEVGT